MSAHPETVLTDPSGGVTVQKCVTEGTFNLDGGCWEVENNVWIVGGAAECVVIDPAHDPDAVIAAVGERTVTHVLLTHGHDDHIKVSDALREATGADRYLHGDDWFLFRDVFDADPEQELTEGQTFEVAGLELRVLPTPGHAPGACCFHVPELATVFTGDTLFSGGPGATGRSFSDFGTIIDSISNRLLTLPSETLVLTGHGDATTIGEEAP